MNRYLRTIGTCLFIFSAVSWLTSSAILSRLGSDGTDRLLPQQPAGRGVPEAKKGAESYLPVAIEKAEHAADGGFPTPASHQNRRLVSKIAFGSCTSHVYVPQPVWENAVIPNSPDVWIWDGDMAYLDSPEVDCKAHPKHKNCNCSRDWLRYTASACLSGDMAHARLKLAEQLSHPDYVKFVSFMCNNTEVAAAAAAVVVDGGSGQARIAFDLSKCVRPILATWDDHDYNWQNGDRRLPTKEAQKHLFLDAIGDPYESERRARGRGMYTKHVLNAGIPDKEIDVLLLDNRYHKDPKPCQIRQAFCESITPKKDKFLWCKDFLVGQNGKGPSCCQKDERMYRGWCRSERTKSDPLWRNACDPTYRHYAVDRLVLDKSTYRLRLRTPNDTKHDDDDDDDDVGDVVCDMLGHDQRAWLRKALYSSSGAPLKLVVTGSPVFNDPKPFLCQQRLKGSAATTCVCLDDFDCFRPAQISMIHSMVGAPGCVVVITGDMHFSDIKVVRSGSRAYSEEYQSENLTHPIYQVMASGLTTNTGRNFSCDGKRLDRVGLREHGKCDFVSGPAFGMVEVDWDSPNRLVRLLIRDGNTGRVRLESKFSLNGCQSVQ